MNAWAVLQGATITGTTAVDVAEAVYGGKPSRAEVEKARRKLQRFVADEFAVKVEGRQKGDPTVYRPVALNGRVTPRDSPRDTLTQASRTVTNGSVERHAPVTEAHAATVSASHPLKGGGRDENVNGNHEGRSDEELEALINSEMYALAEAEEAVG
jgi:hypothetical protein